MKNFGEAIAHLKAGGAVARKGWNGKGMYLYLESKRIGFEPCICMFNAEGKNQPGWVASQPDMLSEDWVCF